MSLLLLLLIVVVAGGGGDDEQPLAFAPEDWPTPLECKRQRHQERKTVPAESALPNYLLKMVMSSALTSLELSPRLSFAVEFPPLPPLKGMVMAVLMIGYWWWCGCMATRRHLAHLTFEEAIAATNGAAMHAFLQHQFGGVLMAVVAVVAC